jgi:hypothetical protein
MVLDDIFQSDNGPMLAVREGTLGELLFQTFLATLTVSINYRTDMKDLPFVQGVIEVVTLFS